MDPCGVPLITCDHSLLVAPIFTLCFLCVKKSTINCSIAVLQSFNTMMQVGYISDPLVITDHLS